MKSDVKEVGKNTLYYGLGNAMNKFLGFILIPIYTLYIPISDFGTLAILETSVIALIQLLNWGIVSGHQRYYYKVNEKGEYGAFLFSNYLSLFVVIIISIIPIFFLRNQIAVNILGDLEDKSLVVLTIGIIVLETLSIIPFQVLQFDIKPLKYISLSFTKLLISLVITIILVVNYKMGIEGILIGRILGLLLIVIFQALFILLPKIKFKFSFDYVLSSVKFGFPLVFSSLGFLVFSMSDIYMLNLLSTKANVGMYSFGFKIANFINLIFVQSIGISYLPSLYKKENVQNNKLFYSKMLFFYVITLSFVILGFILFYREIIELIVYNKEYILGLVIVPIISIGFMIKGMNSFVNVGILINNKTHYFVISSFTTAFFNILLNLFLIPRFGIIGASISTLTSQIINTALLILISNRLYPINYRWSKIILVLLILALLLFINESINSIYYGYLLLIKLMSIVGFMLFVFIIVLNKNEQVQFKNLYFKIVSRFYKQ